MKSSARFRLSLLIFVSLTTNLLLCLPTYGQGVTMNLTSAGTNGSAANLCSTNCADLTNFTITEDGSDHDLALIYTITNNSGSTITFDPYGSIFGFGPITGDPSDYFYVNPSDIVYTTCANGISTLSTGSSCLLTWDVGTLSGAGEVDNDSGTGAFYTDIWYFPPSGPEAEVSANPVYITVQDPAPPQTTPEPSSLPLLGSGVAALVALLRRRIC